MHRICGTNLPSDYLSSSNELFIEFSSDSSSTRAGFLISYEAVERYCSLNLCIEGEGDCGADSECEGSLVCGHNNCANDSATNCCTKTCNSDSDCLNQECNTDENQCRLDSYSTDWSLCTQTSPCNDGEGDCDADSDCQGLLVCWSDYCIDGTTVMDCCHQEIYNGNNHIHLILEWPRAQYFVKIAIADFSPLRSDAIKTRS